MVDLAGEPPNNAESFPYGFCPTCGCHGKTRERRPNGNDTCALGHVYPSAKAVKERRHDLPTLVRNLLARFEHSYDVANRTTTTLYDNGYVSALGWAIDELKFALKDAETATTKGVDVITQELVVADPDTYEREKRLQILEAEVRRLNNAMQGSSDVGFALSTPDVDAARDAALEEAAKVAEAVDPEKPGNWLHSRHKIAFAIRALRGAA